MEQSTNNIEMDLSPSEPVVHSPQRSQHLHISEELKQFILKITTKCEHCGLPIYIKDPHQRICININICECRRFSNIILKKHPYNHRLDSDKLINDINNPTNNTLISRLDITNIFINYISNQCKTKQDKTKKIHFPIDHSLKRKESYDIYNRIIYPNEDIKKLFKLKDTDELTPSNLQEYIKPHIIVN